MICDQDAILCTPDEYWRATVFPDTFAFKSDLGTSVGFKGLVCTNICKFPVLKDHEIVLDAEFL